MVEIDGDDDALVFSGEVMDDTVAVMAGQGPAVPWRILIVDDDPDVHTTTTFALRGTEILGRSLEFFHADSAAQARELMMRDRDIAVILLDVVMEQEDSGLKLVRVIREELGMLETRIILRTGQPGYAPEMDAIRDYDINDYKTKSELTRNKLFTTLTSAIRSYRQICTINASRRGLDMIVHASGELLALSGLRNFSAGVITQISAFLGVRPEGMICVQQPLEGEQHAEVPMVIAAAGRYASLINLPINEISDARAKRALSRALDEGRHLYEADSTTLFFGSRSARNMAAFFDVPLLIDDNYRQLLEVFCTNISVGLENTLLFAQMHSYAYYDSLTGLPNRRQLCNVLDERLRGEDRTRLALVLIDLDGFSETNEALGHYFGDELLRAVAQRMRQTLGNHSYPARLASDTFAVLGPVEQLLPARLQEIFREPFVLENQELMVSATMGIAHLTDVEGDGAEAVKNGYLALRRAKRGQRGEYAFFTRDMALQMRERSKLMQALRGAIDRQRLFLVYQPQISLTTGAVVGVEALLRWRAEDDRLIDPTRFIPIAEHSGTIVTIGEWVLRMACRQLADLVHNGFADVCMAVNVSVGQFRHPRFLAVLQSAIADCGVRPESLELEITESMAMEEADFLGKTLEQIKQLGVKVAIDDFGTGFSSLSYLQRLKVDRLKIDRAFITEIASEERSRRIPELVIDLGRKLGLSVVAEGVENQSQANVLRELGCEEAQGFYWSRPMEAAQLLDWLHTYTAQSRDQDRS